MTGSGRGLSPGVGSGDMGSKSPASPGGGVAYRDPSSESESESEPKVPSPVVDIEGLWSEGYILGECAEELANELRRSDEPGPNIGPG